MRDKIKKPFNVVEKIIVVAIVIALSVGGLSTIIGYVRQDDDLICATNRGILLEQLQNELTTNPNITISDIIIREEDNIRCPSGGVYTEIPVTSGSGFIGGATCSYHGGYDIIPINE